MHHRNHHRPLPTIGSCLAAKLPFISGCHLFPQHAQAKLAARQNADRRQLAAQCRGDGAFRSGGDLRPRHAFRRREPVAPLRIDAHAGRGEALRRVLDMELHRVDRQPGPPQLSITRRLASFLARSADADRNELESTLANRNSPQKHVGRAKIVLLTADGHGTAEIMRATGKAKTVIWRWQEQFDE
jgi:hypothetical protein